MKAHDQRKSSRMVLDTVARIGLDGGFAKRPCRVLDISDSGVRLSVGPGVSVPSTFLLLRSNDVTAGRRAHVVWRKKSQIGAKFI